jgi:hypothetical protein
MDMTDFSDWRQMCLASIDALKSASLDLPAGDRRSLIEKKIKQAEDVLARADAKLAKDLGMHLCDCTWPPQIMRRRRNDHFCPACNRQLGGSRAEAWEPIEDDWITCRY